MKVQIVCMLVCEMFAKVLCLFALIGAPFEKHKTWIFLSSNTSISDVVPGLASKIYVGDIECAFCKLNNSCNILNAVGNSIYSSNIDSFSPTRKGSSNSLQLELTNSNMNNTAVIN